MNPNYGEFDTPLNEVRLQRNWQGVVRYERQFGQYHLLTFESYYKLYDREYPFIGPDYRRYYDYSGDSLIWLFDKADGKKIAYGLEVLFRKGRFDRFYYAFSYSLFTVKNRYVNGNWYNDENNIRSTAGLTLGSNFAKNHGLSFRLAVAGGRPYSAITSSGPDNDFEYDTTKGFYSEQLDPIVTASLRYSFTLNRKWGNLTGYLEIWNLFNQTPVAERYYNGSSGYRDFKPNGILPLAGLKADF
jgi:hypothetical protein